MTEKSLINFQILSAAGGLTLARSSCLSIVKLVLNTGDKTTLSQVETKWPNQISHYPFGSTVV